MRLVITPDDGGTMKNGTATVPAPLALVAGATATKAAPVNVVASERAESVDRASPRYLWAVARLGMGWIFLWPFLDKMFGLGHETPSDKSWINGGNPTNGFLSHAVGPFSGIYQAIAGNVVINVLFMGGLLLIGAALILGIAMWPACVAGATLVTLMWTASLPPANDVFMDDHLIYALRLIGLAMVGAGSTLGLGNAWRRTSVVQRFGWLA
jgi:thiosulfate dehydrogenase [quinone] large subunit